MTETYYQVGSDSSWIVALMPLPAVIGIAIRRKASGVRPLLHPALVAGAAYFLIASVVGFPMEWIMAGASLAGAGWVTLSKTVQPKLARFPMALVLTALALVFFWMDRWTMNESITLTDQQVAFREIGRSQTVPRVGLRVLVIMHKHRSWFGIRPWGSWSSYSGDVSGPSTAGIFWYWGPAGLDPGRPGWRAHLRVGWRPT